ncbi:sodium channel protein Nach [Cephus cinctus]|uniref:Sodium channel protein Nach n=1 Tax=Cephus cinctus TaxID=211228 RepID=A0AAJ7FJP2_CEPCN|nr:sodium channel protein Nach [Cephus cinctus]
MYVSNGRGYRTMLRADNDNVNCPGCNDIVVLSIPLEHFKGQQYKVERERSTSLRFVVIMRRRDLEESVNRPLEKKSLWSALVQTYHEYSAESTVHGIKYTTQRNSILERVLWLLVVIVSIVCAGILASKFYERHQTASIKTLIANDQYPLWKLPLPAVTFCHGRLVTMEKVKSLINDPESPLYFPYGMNESTFINSVEYIREALYPSHRFGEETGKLQSVLAANVMTVRQLFEKVSPNCSDYMLTCRFENKITPCETLIKMTLTYYGICCSFNYAYEPPIKMAKGIKREETKEYKALNLGPGSILSVVMRSYTNDHVASTLVGEGIRILVHERFSYPGPSAVEFVAAAGYETVAHLYVDQLSSSKEVLRISTAERNCDLRSLETYRSNNCYVQCRERRLQQVCGCLPFFASIIQKNDSICNFTHTACLARSLPDTYALKMTDCQCLPNCEDTMYNIGVTALPLNAVQYQPSELYRKTMDDPTVTILHITFGKQSATLQRRELVLSWINLLSSLGGVFSLFLGCSFISVIEIFYFLCHFIRKVVRNEHP